MQPETRGVYICQRRRFIQHGEDQAKPPGVHGLNTRRATRTEKTLQSLVRERPDHEKQRNPRGYKWQGERCISSPSFSLLSIKPVL
jgi:hypothetical protein